MLITPYFNPFPQDSLSAWKQFTVNIVGKSDRFWLRKILLQHGESFHWIENKQVWRKYGINLAAKAKNCVVVGECHTGTVNKQLINSS